MTGKWVFNDHSGDGDPIWDVKLLSALSGHILGKPHELADNEHFAPS
jgi:hypothetical protein